ncbi:flagellar hook-length control protein FliK [Butyrivibrio fibrisolvens]|uniref:flagellar hook-length control protein FliK n=1 Tax=Butyrivibrio fibrisolvens TaxID=831 RepID=UPI000426CA63|nr:flagellar hook-length control protein FliK [Butyrivibrio fibrisolvens]
MPGNTVYDASILSMMPQVATAATKVVSKVQQAKGDDFGSVITDARLSNIAGSDQTNQLDKTLQNTGQGTSPKKVSPKVKLNNDNKDSKVDVKKDESKEIDIKDPQINGNEDISTTDLENQIDKAVQDVEEAGKELISQIADELDVTDEEVLEILNQLGMTLTDLFNPENLTQVVMEVTGTGDVAEVLMDEDLSSSLQNLLESARKMMEDIAADYETEPEEISKMLETVKNLEEKGQTQGQENEFINVLKDEQPKDLEDKIEIKVEDKAVTTNEQVTVNKDSEKKDSQSDERSEEGKNLFSQDEGIKTPLMNPYQQMAKDLESAFSEAAGAKEAAKGTTTSQIDIINQITEHMKVNIKEEMTSMEIQLHPASLGTVKVMVEQAQGGGVTAKFTASTQEAGAALQTQLMQLRQQLDEQGIKVNAVEVTVDAHAFEQNLEQGNQQNASEQETKRQSRIRRINLGDPDLLQEDTLELDEETRLAAEMMAANGQTVDYMA